MGTAPWQDKIKRRHVVRFYPSRNLATFEVDDLVNKVRDALGVLGYGDDSPIGVAQGGGATSGRQYLAFEHRDADRIGLDRWEAAVLYALANSGADGDVEASTQTRVQSC